MATKKQLSNEITHIIDLVQDANSVSATTIRNPNGTSRPDSHQIRHAWLKRMQAIRTNILFPGSTARITRSF